MPASQDVRTVKWDTEYNTTLHIVSAQEKSNRLQQPYRRLCLLSHVHLPKPRVITCGGFLTALYFYSLPLLGVWLCGGQWCPRHLGSEDTLTMPSDWVSNGLGEIAEGGGIVRSKTNVNPKRHWSVRTTQVELPGPALGFPRAPTTGRNEEV